MTQQSIFQAKEIADILLKANSSILIFGHTYPDGDAVGAGLALRLYLQSRGKEAYFILPNPYPQFLAWMPGNQETLIFHQHRPFIEKLIQKSSIFVFIDMNAIKRLEELAELVVPVIHQKTLILFDHHAEYEEVFHYKIWDVHASSTSELIYKFIESCGDASHINKSIAENIYTGIMTDTGSFSYSCNNPETYLIVSRLVALGIDGACIHQKVYNTFTENRLRLFGFGISSRLRVFTDFGAAYIALSAQDLQDFNYQVGDTEGLVNYTLSIKGIHFGVLITEMEEYIKLSFRSEGDVDVNRIARDFFQGGGHKNAAGAYFYGTFHEACQKIEEIIRYHIPKPFGSTCC